MASNKRKRAFPTNKYQKRVLLLAFIPIVIVYVALIAFATLFKHELMNVMLMDSPAMGIQFLMRWHIIVIFALAVVFIIILIWAYKMSANLVGAFERIIRELDEVIAGRSQRKIKARARDELANELLHRVNQLIEGYTPKNRG